MEYIELKNIKLSLFNTKYIGSGTTAHCFKLSDGNVLKLFKDNYRANRLLDKKLFNKDLERFNHITNETFVGPDKMIINKKEEIIGYTYPYVEGKSLNQLKNSDRFLEVYKNYQQVLMDIRKISDESFNLFDIHNGNIIYDNNYLRIIDLDKCFFSYTNSKDLIYTSNCGDVFKSSFGGIYNKKVYEDLVFSNKKLDKFYHEMHTNNIDDINMFLDYIRYYCDNNNPTIGDIKDKVKVKKITNYFF